MFIIIYTKSLLHHVTATTQVDANAAGTQRCIMCGKNVLRALAPLVAILVCVTPNDCSIQNSAASANLVGMAAAAGGGGPAVSRARATVGNPDGPKRSATHPTVVQPGHSELIAAPESPIPQTTSAYFCGNGAA